MWFRPYVLGMKGYCFVEATCSQIHKSNPEVRHNDQTTTPVSLTDCKPVVGGDDFQHAIISSKQVTKQVNKKIAT